MLKKIIIGILAGIISGFFGAGGGMILVPAFIHILHLDEKKARATSVLIILLIIVASSFFYIQANYIDWTLSLKCALGGIFGGYIGSRLLKKLSNKILQILFIIFLSYVSIKMFFF